MAVLPPGGGQPRRKPHLEYEESVLLYPGLQERRDVHAPSWGAGVRSKVGRACSRLGPLSDRSRSATSVRRREHRTPPPTNALQYIRLRVATASLGQAGYTDPAGQA